MGSQNDLRIWSTTDGMEDCTELKEIVVGTKSFGGGRAGRMGK